jgi:IclR family pca regulon transcriptional regulator
MDAHTDGQGPAPIISSLSKPRYSQSLERGLAVLSCFTAERPVLGIAEIAGELGMTRSTTHRYVVTLFALGFLDHDASRKYRLGLRVTDLGMSALSSTGLREQARPLLKELRRSSSHTVSTAVLDGEETVYVDRVRSSQHGQEGFDLSLGPGSRLPAYCTSAGKVLLAYLPNGSQREVVGNMHMTRYGPNSITSRRALLAALKQVREDGYAINDEEMAEGLYSISVPIRSESNEVVAALDMSAHASAISLEEFARAFLPQLVSTADRISARLGYRRADEKDKYI